MNLSPENYSELSLKPSVVTQNGKVYEFETKFLFLLRTRSLRSSSRRCRLPPEAQPQQPSSSFQHDDGGHGHHRRIRCRPSPSSSSAKSCNSKVLSSSSGAEEKEQNSHRISLTEKSCEQESSSETSDWKHDSENNVTGKDNIEEKSRNSVDQKSPKLT